VAVDVASGVESAPGLKDLEKLRLFISQAAGVLPPLVSG
jgi:phosphoribosylanthranilate isomerase